MAEPALTEGVNIGLIAALCRSLHRFAENDTSTNTLFCRRPRSMRRLAALLDLVHGVPMCGS